MPPVKTKKIKTKIITLGVPPLPHLMFLQSSTKTFKQLFEVYSTRAGVPMDKLRMLTTEGKRVEIDDTPLKLKISEGDVLEVYRDVPWPVVC